MALQVCNQIPLSQVASALEPHLFRDPGYHVSDLIRTQERLARGRRIEDDVEFEENGLMSWGRIWEASVRPWIREYVGAMGWRFEGPVKREVDGLIGNLDGIATGLYGETVAVVECKATTGRPAPSSHPNWIQQAQSYCYMEGVGTAWFVVLHSPRGGAPDFRCYLYTIIFTPQELVENWHGLIMMRDYLENAEREKEKDKR